MQVGKKVKDAIGYSQFFYIEMKNFTINDLGKFKV